MQTSARVHHLAQACLLALVLPTACGSGDNLPATDAESGGTSAESGTQTSSSPTTENGVTTNDSPTGDPLTDGSTETDGTPGLDREVCDRYLECVAVVSPGALPDAQQGFGENGTCWQGTTAEMQQCIDACQAGLVQLHMASPDEPKCALCQSNEDCEGGATCVNGECRDSFCGDGIVDPDEICDDKEFCDADCSGPSTCSPLTGAGCNETLNCSFDFVDPVCLDDSDLPDVGENCGSGYCKEGAICFSAEYCKAEFPRCMALCNAQQNPSTCPLGQTCVAFEQLGQVDFFFPPDELANYIGLCK